MLTETRHVQIPSYSYDYIRDRIGLFENVLNVFGLFGGGQFCHEESKPDTKTNDNAPNQFLLFTREMEVLEHS